MLVVALAVAMMSGCGAPAPVVPPVAPADALDVTAAAAHPCDLLRADRAARLGLLTPGTTTMTPDGPGCTQTSTLPGGPAITMSADPGSGIDAVYRARAAHPLFQPATVGRYPAVDTADGPTDSSGCTVSVGVADDARIVVTVGPRTAASTPQDSCLDAHRIATTIIGQLTAGAP